MKSLVSSVTKSHEYFVSNISDRKLFQSGRAGVAKCFTGLCCVEHGWLWVRSPNFHQCLWTHMQKKLGCHADPYTVSRCHTRGESVDHSSKKACKGSTLALKPRADITRSPKQEYQWSNKKDLCPPKIFLIISVRSIYLHVRLFSFILSLDLTNWHLST